MDYSKFYEIDDFKKMFYRDNNFDFQPYPSWTKTTYDLDAVVKYEDLYYNVANVAVIFYYNINIK